MKIRRCLLLIFITCSILVSSCAAITTNSVSLPQDADYVLIGSSMLEDKGAILTFDATGKMLDCRSMDIRDVENLSKAQDQSIYAAGVRSNTNLLIQNGEMNSFALLDDEQYGGSTAIDHDVEHTFSCMNGNISEEHGYESLLVSRNKESGKTIFQTIVPLYATQILNVDNKLYLVGTNSGANHNDAVIVTVDKTTGACLDTFIYPEYQEIFGIIQLRDQIFIECTRKSDLKQEILKFHEGKLTSLEIPMIQSIIHVSADDSTMYVATENALIQLDQTGKTINQAYFDDIALHFLNAEFQNGCFYLYALEILDKSNAKFHIYTYDKSNLHEDGHLIIDVPRYDINVATSLSHKN